MISKVLYAALLVACTQALHDHGAVSSVSFNQHHNAIHHVHSAPAVIKSVAAPIHASPFIKVAAPAYAAPAYAAPHGHASSYSSLSLGHAGASAGHYSAPFSLSHQAAPAVHYAAPVARIAAPAHHATSYSSFANSAPVAHHGIAVAPVAKVVAPVHYSAPAVHVAPAVHAAPAVHIASGHYASGHHEEYAHPKYEFAYGVEDHHTGDIHSHKEVRDGDVTQGEYSLHEADGTIRTVKYSVDKHSGFNAIVERSGHATHAHAPVAKAVVAAPVVSKAFVAAAPAYGHHYHH